MNRPEISVIVPFFKVSSFIERCAESLFQQTFKDVEFIFIDDASPDDSNRKLQNLINRHPELNIQVLSHSTNSGLPASRKTGITQAQGEYIYNCDSDDWVEPDILELLYTAAKANDADIVYCDFFLSFKDNERYMKNPAYSSPEEMLRKGFLGGAAKWNVWNKLIRKSLYAGIEFPVNHFKGGEDMIVIEMMTKAKRIAYVPKALYHYVKLNTGAISEGFSEQRLIDVKYNADKAILAVQNRYSTDMERDISFFKLNVKLPFLISASKKKYHVWKDWYPEANSYIMSNPNLPFRTKFLQWMASKGQWWYVKLYYLLVNKLVYGVFYR